jgi:hypothetical protein
VVDREEAVRRGVELHAMLYDHNRGDVSQLYWIYDLAQMAPDGSAAEIGVYRGGSLVTWAAAREGRGDIYAVDDWTLKNKPERNRKSFLFNVDRYGIPVTIVDGVSWEVAEQVPDDLAFCFIDGDHTMRGIPRDVLTWPDKVKAGGIIAFHDYGVPNPYVVVKCIVDAWQVKVKWEELGTVGSLIAFRKPND